MLSAPMLRIGQGYDLHRLIPARPLMLGGVHIESSAVGADAHSDGDVLVHALIDALLGAMARGDIGEHFPDTDPAYRNAASLDLLTPVLGWLDGGGWVIQNIDCTVVLERPKLSAYKPAIRESLARHLRLGIDQVAFKAKTAEKLGALGQAEGHGQAIAASVTVLIQRAVAESSDSPN